MAEANQTDHTEMSMSYCFIGRVPLATPPHEVTTGMMADIVEKIVEIGGPIHWLEVVARVRTLWGLQRAGNRIEAAVQRGLDHSARGGILRIEGDFYSLPGGEVAVRDRSAAASPSLRKPEMLPPSEIRRAILSLIEVNFGATSEEVALYVSRALGFKATSAQLRDVIEKQISVLFSTGTLRITDGVLSIAPPPAAAKPRSA